MYIRSVIFVLIFSLLLSCKRRVDNISFVVEQSNNGDTISAINYINDTVPHGEAKYYKHGHLSEEVNYENGIKEGIYRSYYPNGKIESELYFHKGVQEGKAIWFSHEGSKVSESYWRYGRKYGPALYYYPNGKIEAFNTFDFDGNNRYVIKYDSNGVKIKEEGVVLGQFLIEGNFDSIPIGKEFFANVSFANPPATTVRVFSYELPKDGKSIELPVKNHTAIYHKVFTAFGRYTIITIGELKNKEGRIVKRDSILTEITVK